MVPSFYQTVDTGIISLIKPAPWSSPLPSLLLFFPPLLNIIHIPGIKNCIIFDLLLRVNGLFSFHFTGE